MAVVHFPAMLTPHTGGMAQLTIDAPRVKELLAMLVEQFPGLAIELDALAVAIDGEVRPDAAYEPLLATSQIDFVPRMSGG